jgi:hypothetical protein
MASTTPVVRTVPEIEHAGQQVTDMETLRNENKQLRSLVIQLSKLVIKHIADQK